MGRYKVRLKNGKYIEADDVRQKGNFVEYITRYDHVRNAINADEVRKVEKVNLGWEGGMRFGGKHDSSFRRTSGSF